MDFPQKLINAFNQADDEYELIASCYCELLDCGMEDDAALVFVTRVGHLRQDPEFGPYADQFENLRQSVLALAKQIDMDCDGAGTGFSVFRENLIQKLKDFSSPASLPPYSCTCICIFYLIEALDFYIEGNLDYISDDSFADYGPRNHGISQKKCLLYMQERSSFLQKAYAPEGGGNFRRPLRPSRLGAMFHSVLLVPRNLVHSVPKIVPVSLPKGLKRGAGKEKLYIASIPFIGFETFRFCPYTALPQIRTERDDEVDCSEGGHSSALSGLFYVEYPAEQEQENIQRVLSLLKLAIKKGANIIAFPEYIMSMEMLEQIQAALSILNSASGNQLLLVLAGTHYDWDGAGKGNNVMHIFNRTGIELGKYYKYASCLRQSEEIVHGARIETDGKGGAAETERGQSGKGRWGDTVSPSGFRTYCDFCEILSNPGAQCTLVDVEGVGRILPSICRDVIDGDYPGLLANLFMPSLLITSAWSPSVNSFDVRMKSLAETIHTTSLLCNCCNAVERGRTATGRFYFPVKRESHMKADKLDIQREGECADSCKERGGCVTLIEVDFGSGNPASRIEGVYYPNESFS